MKIKKLAKGGKTNPPIITNDPKDKRLKAYNDSLQLYNTKNFNAFTEKGLEFKEFIPYDKFNTSLTNLENFEIGDTNIQRGEKIKINRKGQVTTSKPEIIIKNQKENEQFLNGAIKTKEEFYKKVNPNIKPKGFNKYSQTFNDGRIYNQYSLQYEQPVQPIIFDKIEQPIQIDNITPSLLSIYQPDNKLIEAPKNYFTRPRQSQEAGQGKTDMFDKKTGKLMGTYADGGFSERKSKSGRVFKYKKYI